jgi:hypothetical protein
MRKNYGHYVGKTSAEYHQDYRLRKPEQCLLSSARNRARKKGIPFDITVEDIIIPEYCPILGIPLTRNLGSHGGTSSSASLDKISPELGYVKGNVQVISLLANNMKSNATKEQLLLFAEWIKKEYT